MVIKKKLNSLVTGSTGIQKANSTVKIAVQRRLDNVGKFSTDYDTYIKPEYSVYRIKTGDNYFRIAPAADGGDFMHDIFVYRSIGPDRGSYLSPAKMWKEEDPIAELHHEAMVEFGMDHPLVKMTRAQHRVIALGWDTSKEPQSHNILVLDVPKSKVGDPIILLCRHPKTREPFDISDPEEGREFVFVKSKGQGTFKGIDGRDVDAVEYLGFQLGDPVPLTPEQLKQIVPFEELLVKPDQKTLKKIADFLRAKYMSERAEMPSSFFEEKETPQSYEEHTVEEPWSDEDKLPSVKKHKVKIKFKTK